MMQYMGIVTMNNRQVVVTIITDSPRSGETRVLSLRCEDYETAENVVLSQADEESAIDSVLTSVPEEVEDAEVSG